MPLDYNKKLCFIHIPKTGGTGIEMQLEIMNKKKNLWGIEKGRARQHYLWFEYKDILKDNYNNFFKFTLVRNPYSRFISEYYYNDNYGFKNNQSFDDFIETAKDIIDNRKYYNNLKNDHFIPQTNFIYDINNNLIINKIFKLENIQELGNYLVENNYLKIYTNKIVNKSHKKSLRIQDLNKEQKDKIYSLYERDFLLLKYNR